MGTSWISRKGGIVEKVGVDLGKGYYPPYQICEYGRSLTIKMNYNWDDEVPKLQGNEICYLLYPAGKPVSVSGNAVCNLTIVEFKS